MTTTDHATAHLARTDRITLDSAIRSGGPGATTLQQGSATSLPLTTVLDIVVPVFNEEKDLVPAITRLHAHLASQLPYRCRITIADNASTDATARLADQLADSFLDVRAVHLPQKGRGRALKAVWLESDAEILAYMDVDLSTDLAALLPLVAPLISGHSDVAIGTRLHRGARVVRGPKREFISRSYNLILRGALQAHFSDAQCGFKAIRADVARRLLPLVEDTGWFFDTELLVLAERAGLRIHEVPVDWVDDPNSTVHIISTAVADLKGVVRVGTGLLTQSIPLGDIRRQLTRSTMTDENAPVAGVPQGMFKQVVRFGVIGVISTVAYLLLYILLRDLMPAQVANFLSLALTAIANTAANRRFTFGVRGNQGAARHQVQGFAIFLVALAISSLSLFALHSLAPAAPRLVEVAVLVIANLAGTAVRFVLLRGWVFRRTTTPESPSLTTDVNR